MGKCECLTLNLTVKFKISVNFGESKFKSKFQPITFDFSVKFGISKFKSIEFGQPKFKSECLGQPIGSRRSIR